MQQELLLLVEAYEPRLRQLSAEQAAFQPGPGRWSVKEIIGHLIDSAANNTQRFVRGAQTPELAFPGYLQDDWVFIQQYQSADWSELIAFWALYQRHIARVIGGLSPATLAHRVAVGGQEPVTLAFLAEDYVRHLRHHLRQIDDYFLHSK
ncbi:MAG: DinB family protein [Siphonobacter aquaeclarae]|nr:DinB family protein [Siphonobacter aquaeclarae]